MLTAALEICEGMDPHWQFDQLGRVVSGLYLFFFVMRMRHRKNENTFERYNRWKGNEKFYCSRGGSGAQRN